MILSIFEQALLLLPLLIGAYLSISLMKLPDLSIESAYLFGATAAISLQDVDSLPLLLGASLVGGALVGMVSSFLNQFCRLPFLLAAIITNGLFHGITQFVLGKSMLSFHFQIQSEMPFLIGTGCLLVLLFGLGLRSQLGMSFAIYGNNPQFFNHYHISSRFVVIMGICIADACAGLSGFLFAQSSGFVDLTMGFGAVLLCLTSLILGKMLIPAKRPLVFIPLIGIFAYMLIQQFLLNLGLDLKYFNALQALFVLGALIVLLRRQSSQLIDHLGV